jgi:glycosyltransferase involved in cell wall biosynthesis
MASNHFKYDVTIAIINFNGSKFLDRALRSCLDQAYSNLKLEIIVIDDKSTDNSMKYLRSNEYIRKHIRVYRNKKNMGPGYCSMLAVKKSKGKYFMRVDSDDFLNRNTIDIMHSVLKYNKNIGYVYCDHFRTDEFGFKQEVVKLDSIKKLYLHGAGVLFRKKLIMEAGNYNPKFREAEDHDLLLRLDKICKRYYLPVPLYRYYIHGSNISIKGDRKKYTKLIKKND